MVLQGTPPLRKHQVKYVFRFLRWFNHVLGGSINLTDIGFFVNMLRCRKSPSCLELLNSFQKKLFIISVWPATRWASTSYNGVKSPLWVAPCFFFSPFIGVLTPLATRRGPPCTIWIFSQRRGLLENVGHVFKAGLDLVYPVVKQKSVDSMCKKSKTPLKMVGTCLVNKNATFSLI